MPPVSKTIENIESQPKTPQTTVEYWTKIIIGICFIILTVNVLLFVIIPKVTTKNTNQPVVAPISGTIDLNGYIPPGSMIDIMKRLPGTEDFVLALGNITAADGVSWVWDGARTGQPYEIKAVLKLQNAVIAESPIKTIAAPASDETLRLVSNAAPAVPTMGTSGTTPSTATPPQTGTISGKLDLNGYIPPNATVTIQAKKQNDSTVTVITTVKAADTAAWSWNGALVGTLYELQANLVNGGVTIGSSQILTVAAPATNEILTVHSTATSQSTNESISGIFDINGFIPPNATVAIAFRKSGTQQFTTVLSGLRPINNSTWNIPNLQSGISYDILGYLQVNNQNFAQSQLVVMPAPAANETLIINSQSRPSAPSAGTVAIGCVGKGGGNQWQVSIAYNKSTVDQNVKQFILQIGTSGGDSSMVNNQIAPGNPTQPQNYTTNYIFNEGQTYYFQYAYSTCANCKDINFFSQFTNPISFSCSTQPTLTPTPIPSSTPYPTYTPYPTPTQQIISTNTPIPSNTPSPTPKIAQCNESCGSDGFTCVSPLECKMEEGVLGSGVCRNPNCSEKTDCTCE